jgi:protein ImuA
MGESPQARETLFALREAIARIEGKPDHAARLAADMSSEAGFDTPEGYPENQDIFDTLMRDTLAPGHLIELRAQRLQQSGSVMGVGLGLALMAAEEDRGQRRRLLFVADPHVMRETGLAYAPGLGDFGLPSLGLVHALPRRIEDALWLAEAALASRAFSAVLLEVHGNPKKFGLTESRRLSLKARATGGRLIILRQGGEEEASSALLRLFVQSAPAAARHLTDGTLLGGSIGSPIFRILVEKSRMPGSPELILEWNSDDRRLRLFDPFKSTGLGSPHSLALLPTTSDRSHRPPQMGSVLAFAPRLAQPLDRAS